MKFSSEDLMKAMGLQVGDRIKWNDETYTIIKLHNSYFLDANQSCWTSIAQLIDEDYEILPRPKRVGDLKCNGRCPICPCIYVCNDEVNVIDKTLYEVLELGISTFTKTPEKMNEEIHNIIKTRLDKEVE